MQIPRFLFSPMLWRVFALLWFVVLFWLSSQSHLPSPTNFESADKFEHATFFAAGGMCFLLGLRLAGFAKATWTAILVTVLFCGAVGGFDEWHQTYTPGRSGGDVWDWTADLCGGVLGALLALAAERWFRCANPALAAAK